MTEDLSIGNRYLQSPDVVVLVHGIRDFARWQVPIRDTLERAGFIVEPTNFGRFSLIKFLAPVPFFRRSAIRQVLDQIKIIKQHNPASRISFIAHSFGTYVIAQLIKRNFDFNAHRIIFCGSVVPVSFRFQDYQERFHGTILNDVGTRDMWPAMAQLITWGYGGSGTYGFRRPLVRDRWHDGATHGYFLKPDFCEKFWVPYLKSGTVVEGDNNPESPPLWLGVLSTFKVKYLMIVLILVGLWLSVPINIMSIVENKSALLRSAERNNEKTEASADEVIAIDRHPQQLPSIMPASGLNYIDFRYSPGAGGAGPIGVGSFILEVGAKVSWPPEHSTMPMYCELSTLGSVEFYDLTFNLHVSFHNPDRKPGGLIMNGTLVGERDWPILIAKLNSSYYFGFYAYTTGNYMAYVTFPSTAQFIDGRSNGQKQVRLLPINWAALSFPPASVIGSDK